MPIWTMTDEPSREWGGAIRDEAGGVVAVCAAVNVLTQHPPPLPEGVRAVVIGSGRIEPDDGDDDAAAVRTWSVAGREAWAARRAVLAARGGPWWLRAAAGDVLSDVQGMLNEARSWREGAPWRVLLDPVALLTPAMLDAAEEHVARAVDALATHPATAALVLTNAVAGVDDRGRAVVVPSPLHTGVLGPEFLTRAAAAAGATPVVLVGREVAAQRAVIRDAVSAATVKS